MDKLVFKALFKEALPMALTIMERTIVKPRLSADYVPFHPRTADLTYYDPKKGASRAPTFQEKASSPR